MLTELSVKNFAIIDELKTFFGDGLNIISGETGAGKSIIVGAISLLLGDRATSDMIRSSEDSAEVEALFDIENNENIKEKLRQVDFYEGDDLLIKRIISRSGRNRIYINGKLATLGILSSISESLINICGQHEHQLIMNKDNHIDMLDEFGNLMSLRSEFKSLYDKFQTLNARISELKSANQQRMEREDILKFQLIEINNAGLKINEDIALLDEKKVLTNVQKLRDYAEKAFNVLYGKRNSLLEEFKSVISDIQEIRNIDEGFKLSHDDLNNIYYQLEDAALIIRNYTKALLFDPERLEAIDERLESLARLKRKYGGSIEEIIKKKSEMEKELALISDLDEEIEKISQENISIRSQLFDKADSLSRKRQTAARALKAAIEREIHSLKMADTRFEILFEKLSVAGDDDMVLNPKGSDSLEFYLSTNIGEALKPLNRTASGGELSRIMLAMKKVLARTGSVGTIIFDEVDTGIGGGTAEIVGEKLKDVSINHQILCITHIPQIACFGNRHYRVSKIVSEKRTNTRVDILSDDERLEEITRMLGGVDPTEKTREHAKEMLLLSRR